MLAIIADDLTGALDSAAPFAARGCKTVVVLAENGLTEALQEAPEVLSVDLSCREATAQEARRRAAATLAALPAGTTLFLKIDSRLKGHIAELLEVFSFHAALAAPAIPEFGRIVRDGHVAGFGVDTPIEVAAKLGALVERCTIPDTVTTSDMLEAARQAQARGVDLFIGARGLAEALAQIETSTVHPVMAQIPAGPAVFAIGSRDPITLAQIDMLKQHAALDLRPAPNGAVSDRAPVRGPLTLVQATEGVEVNSPEAVAKALADGIVPALTETAATLLLCGGATAEAVLDRMKITHFRLVGECLPGLGLAQLGTQWLIAKSGGFGEPDTLRRVADAVLANSAGGATPSGKPGIRITAIGKTK
ncbi:four-carbon acid sugar kinase family protein [Rhizobium sp. SSA_523]|uniref:four-carbon acid sugar kinase family protein n=1 Tax=Rhizobium sp. SSA_523 TaxID=2952477 RepID=UPI002091D747|nr:four-carbon acid sugar kinase family protein [Rhizobium sp. SSA_523]MCO5732527.1 four-carbon acid sugar kinase family protein [Rhizobium sp. SSA_523]WKC22334.1 four-carbon acid sugar kinase family protein [Rhizobium sp. SSA_523]